MCVNRARKSIEPGHRLLVTIRYMATGELYRTSMRYNYRMPHNTISVVIREVVVALFEEFRDEVWTMPSTPEGWKQVARGFSTRWNFHHCVGAIDGKHVRIVKPKKSGGEYFNYKHFHSIIMMALVDSNYQSLWCSVGDKGKCGDAGIFNRSTLKAGLEQGTLGLPPPEPLPYDNRNVPYFIVGDEAFPLQPWLMKKFPNREVGRRCRIFNYRCSRARLVVENSFGILANRWRCLTTTMHQTPQTVTKIVLGCLTLQNVLLGRQPVRPGEVDAEDEHGNIVPGAWRDHVDLTDNRNVQGNQTMQAAKRQRNLLMDYYSAPVGAVAWQDRAIEVIRQPPRPVRAVPPSGSESESDVD